MDKKELKQSAPWYTFYHEINALFGEDPDIEIEYDEDAPEIKLYVDNQEKAVALAQLLPAGKIYGRIVLKVTVIPANSAVAGAENAFRKALEGNPAFSYIQTTEGIFSNPLSYVVFKKKVVQFFDDNLGDVNGNRTTLYQDIAKDVFGGVNGVFFCTDETED